MADIVPGLQGDLPVSYAKNFQYANGIGGKKVASCAKHFVGDGGTIDGINEENTIIDMNGLFDIHLPAYLDSIRKGVATIMISFYILNGKKMHAHKDLITEYLKKKLKFKGFVISDSEGVDKITSPPHAKYTYSVEVSINVGIDRIRCNWATKGSGTSDDKQSSEAKSVMELTNGFSEDVKEVANSEAPENNQQYTTVYVGNIAPEVTQFDLHHHFHALGAGSIEEV